VYSGNNARDKSICGFCIASALFFSNIQFYVFSLFSIISDKVIHALSLLSVSIMTPTFHLFSYSTSIPLIKVTLAYVLKNLFITFSFLPEGAWALEMTLHSQHQLLHLGLVLCECSTSPGVTIIRMNESISNLVYNTRKSFYWLAFCKYVRMKLYLTRSPGIFSLRAEYSSYPVDTGGVSSGGGGRVKRLGREDNDSTPSAADLKNAWSCTSITCVSLSIVTPIWTDLDISNGLCCEDLLTSSHFSCGVFISVV
jgi:hypothetical protein